MEIDGNQGVKWPDTHLQYNRVVSPPCRWKSCEEFTIRSIKSLLLESCDQSCCHHWSAEIRHPIEAEMTVCSYECPRSTFYRAKRIKQAQKP